MKIEIYWSDKKFYQQEHQKLQEKSSNVERKITGQIQSIHYNKIEITILKLYPKPEFSINWENTIILLETNTSSSQNPVARSSSLNISTLCGCSIQIIVLEKTPIYLPCVSWAKEKSHFLFSLSAAQSTNLFPLVGFKSVFHSSVSLNLSLYGWILSTILLALFCAKFAYNLAISNPVSRWESCKGSVWGSVKKCSRL